MTAVTARSPYDAAMTEPVLSTRALNRALLARQLLLDRSPLPLTEAIEQLGGLQTQYAPSGYIGLWSRLRDFRRESLTQALVDRRVIQGTLIRSTIHMVSAADWPLFAAGTRNVRREWWLRASRSETGKIDVESVLHRVRKLLAEGPRRQAEMVRLLEAESNPRIAASVTVSSTSRKPPGWAHQPRPGSIPRRSRTTSPASFTGIVVTTSRGLT